MRILLIFCFSVFFSSCSKNPQPVFIDYVVQGVLQTEKDIQRIKVTEFRSTGVSEIGVEGAQVVLTHFDDIYVLEDLGEGIYETTAGQLDVIPGGYYVLEVFIGDKLLRSNTTVPNQVFIENQSETSFAVNLDTEGEIVFFCNWIFDGDYSQVVELNSTEDIPSVIPFVNALENFNSFYADPIPNQSVVIKDLNLEFYGGYELWINVINREYESLYFNDLINGENNPNEGIDNIDGGKGFFTSSSQRIIEFNVQE